MKGRPEVILGSPDSFFSECTRLVSHLHSHFGNFDFLRSAATCYGTRQFLNSLLVWSFGSCRCLAFSSFCRSPGTWPGGAWVPGGSRPVFRCWLCCYDRYSVSNLAPERLTCFTCTMGYTNQLACEHKKKGSQYCASHADRSPCGDQRAATPSEGSKYCACCADRSCGPAAARRAATPSGGSAK